MPTPDDYIQLPDGRHVLPENLRQGAPFINPPAITAKDISLSDDVWRGLFGDYRDLVAGTTEAPDIYHFGIIAFVLGVTLARRLWINYARPTYPNFYICEVGMSALTRKGTAWSRGLDLLRRLHFPLSSSTQQPPPLTIVPGVGSAEGLLDCLNGERRVLVVSEEEFRTLLTKAKQEALSNLIPKLTSLYDCPDVETLVTRKNTVVANEPFVSIVTGTTKEWLERSLLESDIHGGFANRFIYLIGEPKSPMAFPPKVDANKRDDLLKRINEIRVWADAIEKSPSKGEIALSDEANAVFEPYYNDNYTRCSQDTISSNLIRRAPLHVMKLALLYAAMDKSTEVRKEHMEAAVAAIRVLEKCVACIFSDFGDTRRTRLEKKILTMLKEHLKVLTSRDICRALGISAGELSLIISGLEKVGFIKINKVKNERGLDTTKIELL